MTNCNECVHISLTEEEQVTNKYATHRCNEFYIQIRHKPVEKGQAKDNTIYPCKICRGSKFKKREEV